MAVLLVALAQSSLAGGLSYDIEGLSADQLNNARAWLGEAPRDERSRAAFLATVRQRVEKSLQALGYYRPLIDLDLDRSGEDWHLQIHIEPREPARIEAYSVGVQGAAERDPAFESLLAESALGPGSVFHHGRYEAMKASILSLGQRRGYFDGQFSRSQVEIGPGGERAGLELIYESGPRYHFGELLFDESVLERQQLQALMPFERGEPFSLSQLQAFLGQLQRTGFFSGVLVQPRLDLAQEQSLPVEVELFPAKQHSLELGLGYSTDTEERLSLVWRTPRLNRWGHSQETRLEYSAINPSGQVSYHIPLSHPLDDVLQLGARLERNEFGDLESDQRDLSFAREQRHGAWVSAYSLRYLDERWRPIPELSEAQPLRFEAPQRSDEYLLAGFSLAHKYRQGSPVNPRLGLSQFYHLEAGSEQAGSGSDVLRATARLVGVVSFADRHRLVARLEAGAVLVRDSQREALAPSLNFFTGGGQSLRGFAYQGIGRELTVIRPNGSQRQLTVGGERLLVGSLEYQYPFREKWRAAVFIDGGDAFDEGHFEANYGLGAGLHYMTPVGAIKLELANSVSEDSPSWRVHINIGAEF